MVCLVDLFPASHSPWMRKHLRAKSGVSLCSLGNHGVMFRKAYMGLVEPLYLILLKAKRPMLIWCLCGKMRMYIFIFEG